MGCGPLHLRRLLQPQLPSDVEGWRPLEINVAGQRLVESIVGVENRLKEIGRFNRGVKAAVGTLAGNEVNLGVCLIECSTDDTGAPLGAPFSW